MFIRIIAAALCTILLAGAAIAFDPSRPGRVPTPESYVKGDSWQGAMIATRARALESSSAEEPGALSARISRDYPIPSDWMLQDLGVGRDAWFSREVDANFISKALDKVLVELGTNARDLRKKAGALRTESVYATDHRWLDLYVSACEIRRTQRLKLLLVKAPHIIFDKHFNMGASHYAYTEGQSDAQSEKVFFPGSALCRLDMNGIYGKVTTLINDPNGVIRDVNMNWDGTRALFAWKKSANEDDYHLYDMDIKTLAIRQLTKGLGNADYEGAYLPNNDIIFNSTRCVQTVDCWWTEVSNLYTCDKNGDYIRRLGFDQVHTNYPQVMDDGTVTYTRWEYNDRGQIFVQALLQMNPDGTNQSEYYGTNSWFPTSLLHARSIPGTKKVAAIASGHHSSQAGKLILIDPQKGLEENMGAQLIAPKRDTKAVRIDSYGQDGEQWMYPYPLSQREFIVSYWPDDGNRKGERDRFAGWYGIYWMDVDGRRELLTADPDLACHNASPLMPRKRPVIKPNSVDYTKTTGRYYMMDVYKGQGMAGVTRGTAKKLRVISLNFRAAGVRSNGNGGPAGGALISTPVSMGNGSWDPKVVLGEATIHPDGSAYFEVPARTPIYFQVLDENNRVIQTMRSWSTLQPGEQSSCVGCHEPKSNAPAAYAKRMALANPAEKLNPLYGAPNGFSYRKMVQPILDRSCVSCHSNRSLPTPERFTIAPNSTGKGAAFSLLSDTTEDVRSGRRWSDSYMALTGTVKIPIVKEEPQYFAHSTGLVNWVNPQSEPTIQSAYSAGAATSKLIKMLDAGHKGVKLSKADMDTISCWIDLSVPFSGDYVEANSWNPDETDKYMHFQAKRTRLAEMELRGVRDFSLKKNGKSARAAWPVRLEFIGADDSGMIDLKDDASPGKLTIKREYRPGDRILVYGPQNMMVKLDEALPETLIFAPDGFIEYAVPRATDTSNELAAYPPAAFAGSTHHVTARAATPAEISTLRNVALNPYDLRGTQNFFPHASASSECRNEGVFSARNAIDGVAKNTTHGGWPVQSWGPEQLRDLSWQVDLGRKVAVTRVAIIIRADFPHDKAWKSANLIFSDGTRKAITLKAQKEPQVFTFDKPMVTSIVRIANLAPDGAPGWSGFTEVEVWGK